MGVYKSIGIIIFIIIIILGILFFRMYRTATPPETVVTPPAITTPASTTPNDIPFSAVEGKG